MRRHSIFAVSISLIKDTYCLHCY